MPAIIEVNHLSISTAITIKNAQREALRAQMEAYYASKAVQK